MKIGIMGGTFDPIHIGHLMLGEFAYDSFSLDEIWFLPNGNPPHKSLNESITTQNRRIEMTKLAIEDIDYFKLQLYEFDNTNTSFSYQTMEHFKKCYPNNDFYFILGADSLFSLDSWKETQRLLNTCTILVAIRDDISICDLNDQIHYLMNKYNAKIELLRAPLLNISSSIIRTRIAARQTVKFLVPNKVDSYIKKNDIYRDDNYGKS